MFRPQVTFSNMRNSHIVVGPDNHGGDVRGTMEESDAGEGRLGQRNCKETQHSREETVWK